MKYLRRAALWLSDDHNRRTMLWTARKVMLKATKVIEALLRDTVDDILQAAG